jgi:hypothetical protein
MRRGFILLAVLVSLFFYSNSAKVNFYSKYTFEEVSYLSPLSSSTIDYINERMTGTKYTIEADLFKIDSEDSTVEIISPNYVKEEVQNGLLILTDVRTLIGNDVKYQYTIYNRDGKRTNWRLYVSSDNLWIASYVNNTANGSEIIMSIYKLSSDALSS